MKEIKTIFRARFDVGIKARLAASDAIQDYASDIAKVVDNLYVSNSSGGPCWTAYCIAESEDGDAVSVWVRQVKEQARRLRVHLDWDT